MIPTAPIQRSIQEFWIDFLLEEEFSSDQTFARSFASLAGLPGFAGIPESVVHSLNDEHGEADLVAIFVGDSDSGRHALLIENKITAGFQPRQADRYRARGVSGKAAGKWCSFRTVLVAPARYIQANHGFDASVSLEQIAELICLNDLPRRAFKLERLQRAIDKKNATGVQVVDPTMTSFRDWYSDLIARRDCGFIPPAPRLAYWGDDWLEWISDRLPRSSRFRHRTKTGMLDLSFAGMTAGHLACLRDHLPHGMTIVTIGTGRPRGAVQIPIAPIKDFSDLDAAKASVDHALDCAELMQQVVAERMIWDGLN